jgi:hypothetical protein
MLLKTDLLQLMDIALTAFFLNFSGACLSGNSGRACHGVPQLWPGRTSDPV